MIFLYFFKLVFKFEQQLHPVNATVSKTNYLQNTKLCKSMIYVFVYNF
jgi:hypothetical protein